MRFKSNNFPAKALARWLREDGMARVTEAIEGRKLKLSDFSLLDLAETFVGQNHGLAAQSLREHMARTPALDEHQEAARLGAQGGYVELQEAGMPVGTTAFSNITGQLIFSEIRDAFEDEAFVFTGAIPVIQSKIAGTEIVPSVEKLGDQGQVVGEGQDYPEVGFGEVFYNWPAKEKRGAIVSLTEEAIFFDLTAMVVEMARGVGQSIGLRREKQLIDVFTGGVNNYDRNGTATNTYLTAGAYINAVTGVTLNDWTDIERLELLFDDILDPDTNEPLMLRSDTMTLITTSFKRHTARQILNATEVRTDTNAAAGTRTFERVAPRTIAAYTHLWSRQLSRRLQAAVADGGLGLTAAQAQEFHWLGDLQKAFAWLENWPLRTFQQGANSESAFSRDVVMRFKASLRGAALSREPRWITRGRNT